MGLSVWCCDQAGPFQTIPQPGESWQPEGKPACQPHEYFRHGTAKILTLFHPADGQVRLEGTLSCTNEVLHGWLQRELSLILSTLPPPLAPVAPDVLRSLWESWQADLLCKPEFAGAAAAVADAVGPGQPGRSQNPRVCGMAVAPGDCPAVYAVGRPLAELGREHPAYFEASGAFGSASEHSRGDHRLVFGGGGALEPGSDPV